MPTAARTGAVQTRDPNACDPVVRSRTSDASFHAAPITAREHPGWRRGITHPRQNPPPPTGPEICERSGRRKTRPKLEYVRLAAPRCGGLGSHFLALGPGARQITDTLWSAVSPLALDGTPVQAVSPGFTAVSQWRNPVSRGRAKLSKASCPMLPGTTQDAGPVPDGSVRAPGLSMTGHGEISMAARVLDKFGFVPAGLGF